RVLNECAACSGPLNRATHLRKRISASFLAAILAFMAIASLRAQDTALTQAPRYRAPNALFVEALGNGGLYSFNYDRRLNNSVTLRGGFTRWTSVSLGSYATRHYTFHLLMLNG